MKLNFKGRREKGITLIALVITIIVLIILAGVSIATLTGDNGILTQASDAKIMTEIAEVKERVQTDILGEQAGNNGELTKSKFIEILNRYFKDVPTEENFPEDLTTLTLETKEEYGSYNIKISEIYNVKFEKEKEYIETATSYVGYYADIDADGTVDGVIYADLTKGDNIEKKWNNNSNSKYTIPTVTEGLKDYYISQTNYKANDGFGTKDVISPTGTGTERFYIMALKDITENGPRYDWYNAAMNRMSDYANTTSGDFGKGKSNTTTMITKWNAKAYGNQDKCSSHKDMWGQIKKEVNNGWFVPSRAEWSAFGGELGITSNNYGDFGLYNYYWSSSQGSNFRGVVCGLRL